MWEGCPFPATPPPSKSTTNNSLASCAYLDFTPEDKDTIYCFHWAWVLRQRAQNYSEIEINTPQIANSIRLWYRWCFEERAISKDRIVKLESAGAIPTRDLIKFRRKANCNSSQNSLWRGEWLVLYVYVLNMECAFMCILHTHDRNGFIKEWSKYISGFRLLDVHDRKAENEFTRCTSVCGEQCWAW